MTLRKGAFGFLGLAFLVVHTLYSLQGDSSPIANEVATAGTVSNSACVAAATTPDN